MLYQDYQFHIIYSIQEIYEAIPKLKDNPLVQRVVEVFDEDQSGGVDFKEFVLGIKYIYISTPCRLSKL